jgi:hypothetical protein
MFQRGVFQLPLHSRSEFKVANHGRVTTAMDENVNSSRVIGRQPTLPVELPHSTQDS